MHGHGTVSLATIAIALATILCGGFATPCVCQVAPTAGDKPASTRRRPFDAVVAIIGDRVILRSTLDREIEVRSRGQQLDRETWRELQNDIVTGWARGEVWVQHGKSIGQQAPAAFEQAIDRLVDDTLERRRRESGSFSSLDEEFGLLGTTWEDVRRRQRSEILKQYARSDVLNNLQRNSGLMVRPREILSFYEEHPEFFHRTAAADLAWVSFEVGDDPEATKQLATAAGAAWAAESLTSEQVADRFGGTDLAIKTDIRQSESDPRAKFLKEFAARGAIGEVSAPIRRSRSFAVLRVTKKTEARSQRFDDPDVQTAIRTRLAGNRSDAWSHQVMLRKQQKIYLWPPSLDLAR